jgi:thiamine-phosphate pyrophosphorylase
MNASVMRILDANANRAREGLRVVEDYARFVVDDESLCAGLKSMRHDVKEVLKEYLDDAILHRDTPGDVGTTTKTPSEMQREDLVDVVTAAGKRVGEALRAIEECLKTILPADAARIEAARYRFYDIEMRVARTFASSRSFDHVRLYVLITETICRKPWLDAAREAIEGGADCLQLREKDLDSGELLRRARQLTELCRQHDRLCIINDRPDIAMLADADGVHVGQTDLPAIETRQLIGRRKILGVSTHSIEQAKQAVLDGADYIGVGPVFRSSTKPREILPGLEFAREVAHRINIPKIAIAGITTENVDEVVATGIRAVAVTASVLGCDDVTNATRTLKEKLTMPAPIPK